MCPAASWTTASSLRKSATAAMSPSTCVLDTATVASPLGALPAKGCPRAPATPTRPIVVSNPCRARIAVRLSRARPALSVFLGQVRSVLRPRSIARARLPRSSSNRERRMRASARWIEPAEPSKNWRVCSRCPAASTDETEASTYLSCRCSVTCLAEVPGRGEPAGRTQRLSECRWSSLTASSPISAVRRATRNSRTRGWKRWGDSRSGRDSRPRRSDSRMDAATASADRSSTSIAVSTSTAVSTATRVRKCWSSGGRVASTSSARKS